MVLRLDARRSKRGRGRSNGAVAKLEISSATGALEQALGPGANGLAADALEADIEAPRKRITGPRPPAAPDGTPPKGATRRGPSPRVVLAIASLGASVAFVDATIVNI